MSENTKDYSYSVYIAYPVEFPSTFAYGRIDEPHSTILFLGDARTDLAGRAKEEILDALSVLYTNIYQWVDTDKVEQFGEFKNITVVTLRPTSFLLQMREAVEECLGDIGIKSPSQFDYNPHVTIDPETTGWPSRVLLHPAQLWWCGERHPFGNHLDS